LLQSAHSNLLDLSLDPNADWIICSLEGVVINFSQYMQFKFIVTSCLDGNR